MTLTDPWEIERRLTQALRRAWKMPTASCSSMPRSNKGQGAELNHGTTVCRRCRRVPGGIHVED
ncbi:hypothetical protein P4234_01485 [Pseudomonas aeruginosa]|nr:hypothetical protein [Pseudomonas aeruginosa]